MAETAAGWYPDPRGEAAQRYWDGVEWTELVDGSPPQQRWGSTPPPGAPPPPPPDRWRLPSPPPPRLTGTVYPPTGGYAYGVVYPRNSQAGVVLALAIIGLLICGPLGIAAMIMARSELGAIKQGRTDPSKRGMAQAAFVIGIIATAFLALRLLLVIPIVLWSP